MCVTGKGQMEMQPPPAVAMPGYLPLKKFVARADGQVIAVGASSPSGALGHNVISSGDILLSERSSLDHQKRKKKKKEKKRKREKLETVVPDENSSQRLDQLNHEDVALVAHVEESKHRAVNVNREDVALVAHVEESKHRAVTEKYTIRNRAFVPGISPRSWKKPAVAKVWKIKKEDEKAPSVLQLERSDQKTKQARKKTQTPVKRFDLAERKKQSPNRSTSQKPSRKRPMVEQSFPELYDVVWAKRPDYPWWPGLVSDDGPSIDATIDGVNGINKVFVQFFGHPQSRDWISNNPTSIQPFTGQKPPVLFLKLVKENKGNLDVAIKEALAAQKCAKVERYLLLGEAGVDEDLEELHGGSVVNQKKVTAEQEEVQVELRVECNNNTHSEPGVDTSKGQNQGDFAVLAVTVKHGVIEAVEERSRLNEKKETFVPKSEKKRRDEERQKELCFVSQEREKRKQKAVDEVEMAPKEKKPSVSQSDSSKLPRYQSRQEITKRMLRIKGRFLKLLDRESDETEPMKTSRPSEETQKLIRPDKVEKENKKQETAAQQEPESSPRKRKHEQVKSDSGGKRKKAGRKAMPELVQIEKKQCSACSVVGTFQFNNWETMSGAFLCPMCASCLNLATIRLKKLGRRSVKVASCPLGTSLAQLESRCDLTRAVESRCEACRLCAVLSVVQGMKFDEFVGLAEMLPMNRLPSKLPDETVTWTSDIKSELVQCSERSFAALGHFSRFLAPVAQDQLPVSVKEGDRTDEETEPSSAMLDSDPFEVEDVLDGVARPLLAVFKNEPLRRYLLTFGQTALRRCFGPIPASAVSKKKRSSSARALSLSGPVVCPVCLHLISARMGAAQVESFAGTLMCVGCAKFLSTETSSATKETHNVENNSQLDRLFQYECESGTNGCSFPPGDQPRCRSCWLLEGVRAMKNIPCKLEVFRCLLLRLPPSCQLIALPDQLEWKPRRPRSEEHFAFLIKAKQGLDLCEDDSSVEKLGQAVWRAQQAGMGFSVASDMKEKPQLWLKQSRRLKSKVPVMPSQVPMNQLLKSNSYCEVCQRKGVQGTEAEKYLHCRLCLCCAAFAEAAILVGNDRPKAKCDNPDGGKDCKFHRFEKHGSSRCPACWLKKILEASRDVDLDLVLHLCHKLPADKLSEILNVVNFRLDWFLKECLDVTEDSEQVKKLSGLKDSMSMLSKEDGLVEQAVVGQRRKENGSEVDQSDDICIIEEIVKSPLAKVVKLQQSADQLRPRLLAPGTMHSTSTGGASDGHESQVTPVFCLSDLSGIDWTNSDGEKEKEVLRSTDRSGEEEEMIAAIDNTIAFLKESLV